MSLLVPMAFDVIEIATTLFPFLADLISKVISHEKLKPSLDSMDGLFVLV